MGDAREEETQGGRGGGEQNEMRVENKRGRRTRHCRTDGTMQEELEDDKERDEGKGNGGKKVCEIKNRKREVKENRY